jgi:hypothetical protein
LKVSPLADTFFWNSGFKKDQRYFFYDTTTPSQAIQGLLEGRRYAMFVENPGWALKKDEDKSLRSQRQEIAYKALEPFNVEAFGGFAPARKIDRRGDMTFLTHIDFATKEDAQRAVEALNDTIVEGRRVQLRAQTINARRAGQFGKVDKGVVAQLKEAGLIITGSGSGST